MLVEFIIPCHNEEQILEKNSLKLLNFLNNQTYNFDWKIILVLNGITDNSITIAEGLKKQNSKIDFFVIKEKAKGNALKTYLNYSSADFLIYMDIDLAVSLENINTLLKNLLDNNYDLVIGSRLLPESKTNRSFIRELSSRIYIFLSQIMLRHNFSDLQCGFKGMTKNLFLNISKYIEDKNWFFDTELLIFANFLNYRIKEIPVDWAEDRYEKRTSKIKILSDSLTFIKNLLKLKKRLKTVKKQNF
jgi:glycosyltransferase involved in cell wall biosynthesis